MAKEKTISETIKEAAAAEEATKQTEQAAQEAETPEEAAPAWGGFKIEVGVVPQRAKSASGISKYDWAAFPVPSNPDDPATWPSVFIPNIGGKTIYNSIKKYRDRLQKEGRKDIPEFTVSVSKEPKGVRVIRKS